MNVVLQKFDGIVEKIAAILVDRTEYRKELAHQNKEAQQKLEEVYERLPLAASGFKKFKERSTLLEYILDHSPMCVCMFDMESRYVYANDRYLILYEKSYDEDVIGKTIKEVAGEEVYNVTRFNHEKVKNGETVVDTYSFAEKGKSFLVQYYPYYNGGIVQVGYVMIATITDDGEDKIANNIEEISDNIAVLTTSCN